LEEPPGRCCSSKDSECSGYSSLRKERISALGLRRGSRLSSRHLFPLQSYSSSHNFIAFMTRSPRCPLLLLDLFLLLRFCCLCFFDDLFCRRRTFALPMFYPLSNFGYLRLVQPCPLFVGDVARTLLGPFFVNLLFFRGLRL